jgi:acetyl-CoA acetyltransferase
MVYCNSTLATFRAEELAAIVIEGSIKKTKIDPQKIRDVIMGFAGVFERL